MITAVQAGEIAHVAGKWILRAILHAVKLLPLIFLGLVEDSTERKFNAKTLSSGATSQSGHEGTAAPGRYRSPRGEFGIVHSDFDSPGIRRHQSGG
ncbi:hypothetical protein [Streptomyces sp. 35G-GA-8]|uniref:hypothetical protein n=1 Tax=Streptomyces sp. 35G-GA-8 TaxID=2939434 RepID=UPI00201F1BFF|nr:hypothetical protein [Streptomyces sp. 35G-GA-8]MCL7377009.1 hypothetical protein [Streptomyces sp. 35G-GA-8]